VVDWWTQRQPYKVPLLNANFHRDLVEQPAREAPKPLNVVMPEGPSFTVVGNYVTWQNWNMHVSFDYREGLVLRNIGCVPSVRPSVSADTRLSLSGAA
jgi:Cu2+-containing amine oxidase